MSSSFDRYRNEFSERIRKVESALRDQNQSKDDNDENDENDDIDDGSSNISKWLKECDGLLLSMKMEIQNVSNNNKSWKQEMMDIHNACQMQLVSYQILNEHNNHDNNDNIDDGGAIGAIGGNGGNSNNNNEDNNKEWLFSTSRVHSRIQSTNELVTNQNARLQNALKSVQETEEVATGIAKELSKNRATLERTKANVDSMGSMTEDAKNLVHSLRRRWFRF